MSIYSKIFHHLNLEDVKRKNRENLVLVRNRHEEQRKYYEDVLLELKKTKSDWRKEFNEGMTTSNVFSTADAPSSDDYVTDYSALDNLDTEAGSGLDGAAARSSGTGQGWDGGIATPNGAAFVSWSGSYPDGNRSILYTGQDYAYSTTFSIQAIQGDYNNGAKANAGDSTGVFAYNADAGWTNLGDIIPSSEGNYIAWVTGNAGDPQGFRADTFDDMTSEQETEIRNLYTAYLSQSGATATNTWYTMYGKIYSYKGLTTGSDPKTFSITIPAAYRTADTVFQLYALGGSQDPYDSDITTNPYAITRIIGQRVTPINVVASLDSPEATSFIRDGGIDATREKKRKEIELRLKAAKEYVEEKFGKDFPGSKYIPPGQASETKPSPMNYQDQYAEWADQLKDDHGHPLFPGGYNNFLDRYADKHGYIPAHTPAYEKMKTLQYMKPPFVVGKMTDSGLDSEWLKRINAENARQQRQAAKEAKMKQQLQSWMNQKNKDHEEKVKQSSVGNIDQIPKSSSSTKPTFTASTTSSDPSPQANPWSVDNVLKKSGAEVGKTASHDKPFSKYPPAGGSDKWPGIPSDKMDILHPKNTPQTDIPLKPFGMPWKTAASGGELGKVAAYYGGEKQKQLDDLYKKMGWQKGNVLPKDFGNFPKQGTDKWHPGQEKVQKKTKKNKVVTASYNPEGPVINEGKLKKPKQFFNPADIKPVHPENPPPETINGYHPDLVDGEKVSQRYNRLDPISAKSMPLTGNPHIDAKVIKARKKRAKLVLRKKNP